MKKLTKAEMLRNWMKAVGVFTKRDLMDYGVRNYYLRSVRYAQELTNEGILERLNESQQSALGLTQPGSDDLASWRWINV